MTFEPFNFYLLQIYIPCLCSILVLSIPTYCYYFIQCSCRFFYMLINFFAHHFFFAYRTFLLRNSCFYYSAFFRGSFSKDLLTTIRKTTQFSSLCRERRSSLFLPCLLFTQNTSLLTPLVTKCVDVFSLTKQFSMTPTAI